MKLLLCIVLLVVPSLVWADEVKPASVPATEAQAFQLGFALQLPTVRAYQYILSAKGMTDDAAGTRLVSELAAMSPAIRASAAHSYLEAGQVLRAMNAPHTLTAWPDREAAKLSAPLVFSNEAKEQAKTDAKAATVMATLDEAVAVKADADAAMPTLTAWLKLTHGTNAVWANNVGTLTADLHASLVNHEKAHPPSISAAVLHAQAPQKTTPAVKDALDSLAPHRSTSPPITPEVMAKAHDALLDAFNARFLLQSSTAEK